MSARVPWSTGTVRGDAIRERSATVNQLLTGLLTLVAVFVVSAAGEVNDAGTLVAGLALMFVVTGVTIVVPWSRVHPLAVAVVPLVDVVAVSLLETSSPHTGFALLWVLPSLWLSAAFGAGGLTASIVTVSSAHWIVAIVTPDVEFVPTLVLTPLTMTVISVVAFLATRRANAQRALLAKQGELLARAVDRAQRQEAVLAEVLDAVDFGVVRVDVDGRTTMANEAHARLLAAPRGDERSREVYAADGVTRLARDEEPIVRAERGETFESELVWYGAPATQRRALNITSRALRRPDGTVAGGLVVSQDVTAEVMALRAREDLIASVSHELRTPLTSILGYVDLALDSPGLPEKTRAGLDVVERNATRLLQIVSDLLTAAAEARHGIALTFHPAQTDLAALAHAAVDAIRTQAEARSMAIGTTGIEAAVGWVDPLRMRQVVDNLLSNAVKYGREGGLIEVGVTSDVDHAWIVVRDDGPGIASEEVPLLFDRFYRSDVVRHTSTHGSGLGLAISLDMMRAQGGDITVHTRVGEGSTFIVRVPHEQRSD